MVMITRLMPDTKKLRSFGQNHKLHDLLMGMKNAVENHNTSAVIITDGRSGYGKTTISFQSCITVDPSFDLSKVHYTPKTFLEGGEGKVGLANCKRGDALCFDEAMLLSSRSALSQINKMIIQAMSMIRSKQIYVFFNVNSIFDLDRNLVLSRADCLIHVYADSAIKLGKFACFFKAVKQEDRLKLLYLYGKKFYSYSRPRSNFIGTFTKEFIVEDRKYNEQKDQEVKNFLLGDSQGAPRSTVSRDKLIVHLIEKYKASPKEIKEVCGLGLSRLYEIINKGGNAL